MAGFGQAGLSGSATAPPVLCRLVLEANKRDIQVGGGFYPVDRKLAWPLPSEPGLRICTVVNTRENAAAGKGEPLCCPSRVPRTCLLLAGAARCAAGGAAAAKAARRRQGRARLLWPGRRRRRQRWRRPVVGLACCGPGVAQRICPCLPAPDAVPLLFGCTHTLNCCFMLSVT